MVSLIIGHKGSGKTKLLVEKVNAAIEKSNGNVICVEKETKLTYDVNYRARLVAADSYSVQGFSALYGFLSGLCASNHDITDIFVDATLRIGSRDFEELADFLEKVDALGKLSDTKFTFTISTDKADLPERVFTFCEQIN